MNSLLRPLIVCFVVLSFCRTNTAQRNEVIKWDLDLNLTAADKTAIEKVAKKVGIDVARVRVVFPLPTGGQLLLAESRVSVEGRHRTWLELDVCRKDWEPRHCSRKSRRSVDRWQASALDLVRREAWNIQDGNWSLDVPVEPGLPFNDIEQIVLAIRHDRLVNRLPEYLAAIRLNTGIPRIDPAEITGITRTSSGYEVREGRRGGLILRVRIVDGKVEIFGYGTWLV